MQFHARNLRESPQYICRSTVRSNLNDEYMMHRENAALPNLLVEDAVPLVDVRDVALVLVVPLPRELLLLVHTAFS